MKRITTVAAIAAIVTLGGSGAYAAGEVLDGDRLKQNDVDSTEIQNNSLTSLDIQNGGVLGTDLRDGTITAADIATGAVDGSKIKDATITGADMRGDTVDWMAEEISKRRGGGGRFLDHSEVANGYLEFNNRVTGDQLLVVHATFTTDEPVKVTLTDRYDRYVNSCIADPAGFAGKVSCTMVQPYGLDLVISSKTADGQPVGDTERAADGTPNKNLVQSALVKLG
jgi:2',3'-cyclic-nucleotide 2'-phosphodiesterase (5'-nucleotidase family)